MIQLNTFELTSIRKEVFPCKKLFAHFNKSYAAHNLSKKKHLLCRKKSQPVDNPSVCTPLNQKKIYSWPIHYHKREEKKMRWKEKTIQKINLLFFLSVYYHYSFCCCYCCTKTNEEEQEELVSSSHISSNSRASVNTCNRFISKYSLLSEMAQKNQHEEISS